MDDKTVTNGQGMLISMSQCSYFYLLCIFLYRFHYSVSSAIDCHHFQGLLSSSPRELYAPVATWTHLLSNFTLPVTICLVTGPTGALTSDFSSLSCLEISLRLLSSWFSWFCDGEAFWSSNSLVSTCLIGCRRFLCKIFGFASGSPWGLILNMGMS